MYTDFEWETRKEREHLWELVVDGEIILKYIKKSSNKIPKSVCHTRTRNFVVIQTSRYCPQVQSIWLVDLLNIWIKDARKYVTQKNENGS